VTAETLLQAPALATDPSVEGVSDRRADIDAKMARVAELLKDVGCDGLMLLEPENFAWLTSGATARGVLDSAALPGLYCNGESRWVLASNSDSQRLFDEELDGLGFQLKEWPWHWGRDQLVADLSQNRKIACDVPLAGAVPVTDALRALRRSLTPFDQACFRALGQVLGHALEATCRSINPHDSEREVAGHLAHRLLHRGVHPLQIGVAADGRSRLYRHFGSTPAVIGHYAVLTATARKYGLCATASRGVCFGELPDELRQDHNAVCRVSASYLAATWPDAVPREILLAGRRIYHISNAEHEWLCRPQGHVSGRAVVELPLTPQTEELFQSNWAVTWSASSGAALSSDTFLITDEGPKALTPTEIWPLKRIRIQGAEFTRPDILQR
jgi:Xaa-Pro aminopeptidase